MKLETLSCSLIDPDLKQPRQSIEETELVQLAMSIRELGLLQPIIVFENDGRYTLVDGHRRFAALGKLNTAETGAIVLPNRPDADMLLTVQMAVNCHRVDLKPTEKAAAYARLKESKGWTNTELAKALHVSKSTVTQTLSYLTLPEKAKEQLDAGKLAGSTAYAISRAPNEKTKGELLEQASAGTLKRSDVGKAVGKRAQSASKIRATFSLGSMDIIVACGERPELLAVVAALQQLGRECRKAAKRQLDINTLERILADEARAASSTD